MYNYRRKVTQKAILDQVIFKIIPFDKMDLTLVIVEKEDMKQL